MGTIFCRVFIKTFSFKVCREATTATNSYLVLDQVFEKLGYPVPARPVTARMRSINLRRISGTANFKVYVPNPTHKHKQVNPANSTERSRQYLNLRFPDLCKSCDKATAVAFLLSQETIYIKIHVTICLTGNGLTLSGNIKSLKKNSDARASHKLRYPILYLPMLNFQSYNLQ